MPGIAIAFLTSMYVNIVDLLSASFRTPCIDSASLFRRLRRICHETGTIEKWKERGGICMATRLKDLRSLGFDPRRTAKLTDCKELHELADII
jgi:hypothetical protein